MWATAPVGYLPCDGSLYNVADYDVLYDILSEVDQQTRLSWNSGADWVTTFATPDLRGEFIRGSGANSHANQGNGAAVGVHQDGTRFPNVWSGGTAGIFINKNSASDAITVSYEDSGIGPTTGRVMINGSQTTGSQNFTSISSRPTNTSLLFAIKY